MLQRRCDVFMQLIAMERVAQTGCDVEKTASLIKLLDAGMCIRMGVLGHLIMIILTDIYDAIVYSVNRMETREVPVVRVLIRKLEIYERLGSDTTL